MGTIDDRLRHHDKYTQTACSDELAPDRLIYVLAKQKLYFKTVNTPFQSCSFVSSYDNRNLHYLLLLLLVQSTKAVSYVIEKTTVQYSLETPEKVPSGNTWHTWQEK